MRKLAFLFVALLLAACSPTGENKQVPTINGVPLLGGGMGGGGIGIGR